MVDYSDYPFEVGQDVYYIGSLGTVRSVNDNGTYTLDLRYGARVDAYPWNMAPRT